MIYHIDLAPFTPSKSVPRGLARLIDDYLKEIVNRAAALHPGVCVRSLFREAESIFTEWLAVGPHTSHRCPRFARWDAPAALIALWRRLRRAKRAGHNPVKCAALIFPRSLLRTVAEGVNAYARRLALKVRRTFDASFRQSGARPVSVLAKYTGVSVKALPAKQPQTVRLYA
jgi:hypothetical protein